MDIVGMYAGFMIAVLNVVLLGSIVYMRWKVGTMRAWLSTTGMVFASGLERQKTTDRSGYEREVDIPVVHYSYQVGGQLYESTRVTFGPEPLEAGKEVPTVRYPTGAQVTVFYDPQNPREAVLERKAPLQAALWLILGLMDFMICLASVWGKFQK